MWAINEEEIYNLIAYVMIIQAIPIFFILLHILPAPWGKTKPTEKSILSTLLGPAVPAKLSWFLMESPNLMWCILLCYRNFYQTKNHQWNQDLYPPTTLSDMSTVRVATIAHFVLLGMFFTHYTYRAIIYPHRMSRHTTYMPTGVVLLAFTFCTVNGYLQAQGLCRPFVTFPTMSWERSYQFWVGSCVFLFGFTMNIRSDTILRKLRQRSPPKQHGIPYGEMFRYVSNPHYLGEIIEWIGYCIACNYSLSSVAFVIYTMANLIPRAVTNHRWYTQHFPAIYPQLNRKAIIPFIW